MPEFDISRSKPLGKGAILDRGIHGGDLASRFGLYKGRIASAYRAIPPEEIPKLPSGGWVSKKIDGALWFLVLEKGEAWLANPRGNVIKGDIPLLKEAASLARGLDASLVAAGELHVKVDGRRCRVGDLGSMLGGGASADVSRLCFAAFDVLPEKDQPAPGYADRLSRLKEVIQPGNNLWVVETSEAVPSADIQKLYDEQVVTGLSEGLVVRTGEGMVYKLKPVLSIDAVILGYTVKADVPDSVRSILLGLVCQDGMIQILGACGGLGSDEDRKLLMAKLAALKTASSYRFASDGGGLYTFVKPEIVAEIKVNDLQGEKSDGNPVTTMKLSFDGKGYAPLMPAPGVSPIHPVLVVLREDKQADAVDTRFAQVEDWVAHKAESGDSVKLPQSELLQREVWKKEGGGKTAIRKLLVWKTNKESVNPAFPAYVVHWTDYSAGRGTPLDREVRLAMDQDTAASIAEKMVADNIKKGWEKVA